MIEKWITNKLEFCGNFKIFDLFRAVRTNPAKRTESEFIYLDSKDWVNIIPITKQGNIVLVEQYRHGIDDISLEIPAGLIETGESPQDASERELREETGYQSSARAILLGDVQPNPAFLNNTCYHYVCFDCEHILNQDLDENELIKVVEIPLSEIDNYIKSKKIRHSLVLSAFYYFKMHYNFNDLIKTYNNI